MAAWLGERPLEPPNQARNAAMKPRPKREKKTHEMCFLVSFDEKLTIEAKSSSLGMNCSEFIRYSVRQVRVTTPHDRNVEKERSRQIAKIGNNLNQIAKWVNSFRSAADAVMVCSELKKIHTALDRLYYPKKSSQKEPDDAD